jgi:hypothetical protein
MVHKKEGKYAEPGVSLFFGNPLSGEPMRRFRSDTGDAKINFLSRIARVVHRTAYKSSDSIGIMRVSGMRPRYGALDSSSKPFL